MAALFERTLFKIGGGFALTLPKSWVRYYGLKPGDRLEIISNDDLIIRVKQARRLSINLRKDLTR
jgi:bifunctional DNA-binding transcriptional regulator/antitoxin component of YhaV-PrlF toxin-antitoxin module